MLRCKIIIVLLFCALAIQAQTPKERLILQTQDFLQQGNFSAARALLADANKTYPNDPGFANLLGIIEAQQGNLSAAETAFKKALTRNPKFTGAALNLGRLYLENAAQFANATNKALPLYQRILQYDSNHTAANYQCAVLLQLAGDYQTSLLHIAKLPGDYQQSAQVLATLCANYAGLGNRAKADAYAAQLSSHTELSATDVMAILPVLEKHKRDDLVANFFAVLIAQQKATPEIFYRAGLLQENSGQLETARDYLAKSVSNEQPSVALLLDLARVAHKQKDYQGALGYLAHARDLEPRNAALHYSFGLVCVNLNLGAEAFAAFGKALEIAPNNADYNYAMGVAAMYRHDPGEAIPYLQKFLQLRPNNGQGQLLLGSVYFKIKDYDAARQLLQLAVKSEQTAASAHFYLGRVARQENKLDEALRELAMAIKLNSNNADAQAEMGQCYLQLRDYVQAEQALQRALIMDGDNYAANFNLLTLYSRTKDKREAEQAKKFEEVKTKRTEQMNEFLRVIEIRPNGK